MQVGARPEPCPYPPQFVSATNYLYGKLSFAALYVVITILSVLADSVCPRNALVNSLDRIFATLGTILSPVRHRDHSAGWLWPASLTGAQDA